MHKYTFYVEGLGREFDIRAENEKDARNALWNSMSPDEMDSVVQIECVDYRESF